MQGTKKPTTKTALSRELAKVSSATIKLLSVETDCAGYRNGRANNSPSCDALAAWMIQKPTTARAAWQMLSRGKSDQLLQLITLLRGIPGADDAEVGGWKLSLSGKVVKADQGTQKWWIERSLDARVGLVAVEVNDPTRAIQLEFSAIHPDAQHVARLMLGTAENLLGK